MSFLTPLIAAIAINAAQPGDLFQLVDPENPPQEGVFLTWDGVREFVDREQKTERQRLIEKVKLETERDIARNRAKLLEAAYRDVEPSPWRHVAFVGCVVGGILTGIIIGHQFAQGAR